MSRMQNTPNVLFVESSELWGKMLGQICDRLDLRLRIAPDVASALSAIANEIPSTVVAGYEHRDFTAMSLVAALRSDRARASIPIALLTSSDRDAFGCAYTPDLVIKRDADWTQHVERFLEPVREAREAWEVEQKPTVMLVEDNMSLQYVAGQFLHVAGYDVTIAENGRQALDLLESRSFDMIFMDIEMPEMDGREAIKHIRASGIETPVVALTGHAREAFEEEALSLGFNALCSKPVQRSVLIEACALQLAQ